MQTCSCLCSKLCTSVLILSHLSVFCFFSLVPTCLSLPPQHPLSSCRWCVCVKTPNWLWRTAPHTSWTCCQTPTSTCAPSCPATKAKWRLWGRTSTSGSSWRTWPRRPNKPSACSRRGRSACTRRTRSLGEWSCLSLCSSLWKATPLPAVPSPLSGWLLETRRHKSRCGWRSWASVMWTCSSSAAAYMIGALYLCHLLRHGFPQLKVVTCCFIFLYLQQLCLVFVIVFFP